MLYLFFGEDTFRSRQGLHKFIERASYKKVRPTSFLWLTSDTFSKSAFQELLRTGSLFGEQYLVVCEGLLKEAEAADFLAENLKFCADSENIFIFWEEILEKSLLNIFKKCAEKIEEFNILSLKESRVWLEEEARRRKVTLPVSLKEELIHQCGANLWLLSQELEKYALTLKTDSLSQKKE
jgi:hypothetical protein